MARLPDTHPSVHKAFMEGKFVVQRSDKKASLMTLDQSQEHSIKFLKQNSEAKGFYGQPEEKEVIELSKPEVLKSIDEFERACFPASRKQQRAEYPDCSAAEEKKFLNHLKTLCDLVNPFKVTIPDLITFDTGEVMDPAIIDCLQKAHGIGKDIFTEFVSSRI